MMKKIYTDLTIKSHPIYLRLILIVLLSSSIYNWVAAQSAHFSEPESVGVSSERLQLLEDYIQSGVRDKIIPGGVFLVARKGQVVFHRSYGFADKNRQRPSALGDIFRIASMTKAITTVAIMQLYEQGKLKLDDPVEIYIPAFKSTKVLDEFSESDSSFTTIPQDHPLTIRNLLTHTSGLYYGGFERSGLRAIHEKSGMISTGLYHESWTTKEWIDSLAHLPLAFQPGSQWKYGLNMDVLGRIIEVISGRSLSDYFEENIFQPLEMNDSYFYLPDDKESRLVDIIFTDDDMAAQGARLENYPTREDKGHYAGGGGLSSTAYDYARFLLALLNHGTLDGKRILSRRAIEIMTADQISHLNKLGQGFSPVPGITFCLGFALVTEEAAGLGPNAPGTFSWGGYFNTKYFIDTKEELVFVGMTQILPFPHQEFWDKMYPIIYSALD